MQKYCELTTQIKEYLDIEELILKNVVHLAVHVKEVRIHKN